MTHPADSPLSFGQRYHWWNHYLLARGTRHELNLVFRYIPPPGATVESLQLALDYLVGRHEALRTTFHCEGPVQRVHPTASVSLMCIDTDGDDAQEGIALSAGLEKQDFDLTRDYPIRAFVFTKSTKPTVLTVVLHHIAVDNWGGNLLLDELGRVHTAIITGQSVPSGETGPPPSELARLELSDVAAPSSTSRSSLAYWEREMATAPADTFASRRRIPARSEPVALSASLASPACLAAARELAIRYRVWPSIVYFAAFIVMLHRYTGQQIVTCRLYCANRDEARRKSSVAPLFLPVMLHVDCGSASTFADVIQRTAESSAVALTHSQFPYDEVLERMALRGCRGKTLVKSGAIFNFLNHGTTPSALKRTVFLQNPPPTHWAQLGDDIYFQLRQWRDCAVAVLNALTAVMSADEIEGFLRGFEAILKAQAAASSELKLPQLPLADGFGPAVLAGHATHGIPGRENGKDVRDIAPFLAAKVALEEAFQQANGRRPTSLSRCYVDAGGKLIRAPRLLEILDEAGWSGLRLEPLAGPVPLASAARDMSRVGPGA